MTKVKVSITVDSKLGEEINQYHRDLVLKAVRSGQAIPKLSNVYEEIISRGWEAIKKEKRA